MHMVRHDDRHHLDPVSRCGPRYYLEVVVAARRIEPELRAYRSAFSDEEDSAGNKRIAIVEARCADEGTFPAADHAKPDAP